MEKEKTAFSIAKKPAVKKKGWWARYVERLSKVRPDKPSQIGLTCKQ